MASGSGDDLDWLYGRERRAAEPEPTRVLPPSGAGATAAQPAVPASAVPVREPPQVRPVRPVPPPAPPPGGDDPGGNGGRPPKRRRPVRNGLRVLLVLVLVLLAGLVGVPAYAWSQVHRVDDAPSGERPANQPGTTFLLVGSDSRAGLSKAERQQLGTGNAAGGRTDTIMLMSIPPGGRPALISIPRDSYVPIPGHGRNKINAAFALGGPKLLEQTVEQDTGLRVDGYLEIGFGGFVNVIDAVGGIQMCLPKAIKDKDSHLDLPKGCQELGGTDALGYVRMRHADPRGDLGRVERQRAMLAAVAKKGLSPSTLLNPVRYWDLTNATADALALGQDTSFLEMVSLARAMRKVSSGKGLTLTVPVADPNASTPAGSAVLWNTKKAQAMFAEIARGDTSDLGRFVQ